MTTLIKLNLRALFSRMFMRSRSAKKRGPAVVVLIALLAVYVVATFFFMFGTMFWQLGAVLFPGGYGWLYFAYMGISVFGLCFVGSIFAAQNQIFNAKDNDLLLSLPVKPSHILVSRIVSLLMLDYLFEAFIAIPAFIIWLVVGSVSGIGVLFFIIAVLLLPLLSLAVASFFAWLIALITSRLRNKNIITLLLSLLFLAAYFLFFSNIQKNLQYLILNSAQLAEGVQNAIFPAYHLGVAIDSGNILSMLIFVLCAVVPFVLAVLILSANFIKIATTNRGAIKIKYTEKALKVSGVLKAFTVKELRHFISNPMYIMNTALGGVFMVVGAVIIAVKRDILLGITAQLSAAGMDIAPATLLIIGLGGIAALNFVSAPTISLEGKNLWIAKSLPVRPFTVLLSKAMMHILVCGVPAVLAALILAAFVEMTVLQALLLVVVPLLFTILTGLLGVVINLLFPKFDWINEIQPIKQGMASMLTMFGAAAIVGVLVLIYAFLLGSLMTAETYLLLCAALLILLSGLFINYLEKGGTRRFDALNND